MYKYLFFLLLLTFALPGVVHAATTCGFPDAGSTRAKADLYPPPYESTGPILSSVGSCEPGIKWVSRAYISGSVDNQFYSVPNAPYYEPSLFDDASDFDENACFTAYENLVCPGDPHWADEEGYDENGFDSDGLDRGGYTSGEGGGYSGSGGTGGSSPQSGDWGGGGSVFDPQSGNNYDGGVLQCSGSFPGYIVNTTPSYIGYSSPGYICSNDCQYYNTGSSFDSSSGYIYEDYSPTGNACTGEEPVIPITIGEHSETPAEAGYECYLNNSIWNCFLPPDISNPIACYQNDGGYYGAQINCPQNVTASPDNEVCGYINGIYDCYDPAVECQYVSGDFYCFIDGSPVPVPETSPDHPINGGNLNGNENDDVLAVGETSDPPSDQTIIDESRLARLIGDEVEEELAPHFDDVNSNLESINDTLNNANVPEWEYTAEDFDYSQIDADIAVAKALFASNLASIKSEASTIFNVDISSTGALPCPSFEVWGHSFEICIADYDDQLSVFGLILIFMAYVIGFFIILR